MDRNARTYMRRWMLAITLGVAVIWLWSGTGCHVHVHLDLPTAQLSQEEADKQQAVVDDAIAAVEEYDAQQNLDIAQ